MSDSFDRLVSRSILSQSDRIVRSDPDDSEMGQRSESDSSSGVRDEVEESS